VRFVVPTDKHDVGITHCKTSRVHRHIRCIGSSLPESCNIDLFSSKKKSLAKVHVNFVVARRVHDRDAHLRKCHEPCIVSALNAENSFLHEKRMVLLKDLKFSWI